MREALGCSKAPLGGGGGWRGGKSSGLRGRRPPLLLALTSSMVGFRVTCRYCMPASFIVSSMHLDVSEFPRKMVLGSLENSTDREASREWGAALTNEHLAAARGPGLPAV